MANNNNELVRLQEELSGLKKKTEAERMKERKLTKIRRMKKEISRLKHRKTIRLIKRAKGTAIRTARGFKVMAKTAGAGAKRIGSGLEKMQKADKGKRKRRTKGGMGFNPDFFR